MTIAAATQPRGHLKSAGGPLVSILIPAYNAEKWIRYSIQSALGQTYAPIEVIVVDDGSTDGTVEEVLRFGDQVRLIHGGHAGANASRNLATAAARGEWLQYLDADDYLLPNKIADQIRFLRRNDWQFDTVYSPTILREESTCAETPTEIQPPYDVAVQFVRWVPFCTHGMLLRRSAVIEAGGWREDQPVCQEHELILRLITANRSLGIWNQPATVYRFHSSGTISKNNPLRTMRMRMSIVERFEGWLEDNGRMTPALRKEIYAARMDTARVAWAIDEAEGEALARQASRAGHHWIHGRHALPLSFQILTRAMGFRTAQRIARFVRTRGHHCADGLPDGAVQNS